MNLKDTDFIKHVASEYFFRCFGEDATSPLSDFNKKVSSWSGSPRGLELTHILMGVKISVESQGMLHVLKDGSSYLGFCVLGSRWTIQSGNTWYYPKSTVLLQKDLSTIKTHRSSLIEMVGLLESQGVDCTLESIGTGIQLAQKLGEVKWSGSGEEVRLAHKRFSRVVNQLDYKTRSVNAGMTTIITALSDIASKTVNSDQHVTFPEPADYIVFRSVAGIVLSRFGKVAPSFNIVKRRESFKITEKFGGAAEDEASVGLRKGKSVLIAMKPLRVAVDDYNQFARNHTITSESSERAADFRHVSIGKKPAEEFLQKLGGMLPELVEMPYTDVLKVGDEDDTDDEDLFGDKMAAEDEDPWAGL
jgi:hypothetical protein